MKPKKYIIKEIKRLVKQFPSIKIWYGIDSFDGSHIIKVSPRDIYENDKDFKAAETQIILEFIKKFPDNGLFFITENDLVDIEPDELVFSIEGENYTPNLMNGIAIAPYEDESYFKFYFFTDFESTPMESIIIDNQKIDKISPLEQEDLNNFGQEEINPTGTYPFAA